MIRLAQPQDLQEIQSIYAYARTYMRQTGNPTQWSNNYPSNDLLKHDMAQGKLFVGEEDNTLLGVFYFAIEEDATYAYIEGAWKNDEPYGVIHRVASSGKRGGFFGECLRFCEAKTATVGNLRMDTHENNKTMQHVLEKHGFERCGIIYLEDGAPRIAYQKQLAK